VLISTVIPPRVFGNGGVPALTVAGARPLPKIEWIPPGTRVPTSAGFAALVRPPAVALGAGPTGTFTELDKPPPVTGLNTKIVARPDWPKSLAGSVTCSVEALPYEVGWSEPFHRTTEVRVKFDPVSAIVIGFVLALTLAGESALI
jgi:hypothetical protein